MRQRQRHRGQTFARRPDEHHRVLVPGRAGLRIANATPEVYDFLSAVVRAAGSSELSAPNEVLRKGAPYCFEATVHLSPDAHANRPGKRHAAGDFFTGATHFSAAGEQPWRGA